MCHMCNLKAFSKHVKVKRNCDNFINIFYLTQYIKNIISSCDQYKDY